MPTITIGVEEECQAGWRFEVYIEGGPQVSSASRHQITLSWADYEHWSGGAHPPARVIEALARFLVGQVGPAGVSALAPSFDAARVRRTHPSVDRDLPTML